MNRDWVVMTAVVVMVLASWLWIATIKVAP